MAEHERVSDIELDLWLGHCPLHSLLQLAGPDQQSNTLTGERRGGAADMQPAGMGCVRPRQAEEYAQRPVPCPVFGWPSAAVHGTKGGP